MTDRTTRATTAVDGRSTRWDDHRAARRAELVRAARKAVHRVGPGVSMDEIAAEAGTSKSIVYRYFEDKAGLRLAVAANVVATMHDALREAARSAPTPHAALRAMVRVYLEMIEHSPNVYWFVTRTAIGGNGPATDGPEQEAPLGAYLDSVIELVAEPFARAVHVPPATAAAWAAGAVGFVRGAGEWWLAHPDGGPEGGRLTREELTEQVTLWLWNGPVGVLHHDEHLTHPTHARTQETR
ncbi:TetR/AcrR family transcriptional regulator [Isoptericola variabilis]|uniref:Regulatory protein TetR n=1 Tax=Isoptericola variabilis (strain 225) TaxID=743718 RepID=F6FSZ3_ISOV2|nr:TetR/AcrR family transcriptional regulator [Isoptericola variabilis]AEG43134.1 regulatory protein TetR [Isoptericola variabilis 225]TWH35065.1 TetR family transcriptional regulator [Isoptericola variabilis J7]